MRKFAWSFVLSLTVFAIAKVAAAHSFICEKTVNGQSAIEVSTYPTTLHFDLKVINNHSSLPSTYTSVSDPALTGFTFEPAGPYEVPFGQSVSDSFDVVVSSADECKALAAKDGTADNVFVNTLTVTWESGQASCSASVTCLAPPPPPGAATRTPGFYKTHISALQQCLDEGPIDLGFISIGSVEEALGLLWGTPSKYTGTFVSRSDLDRARFILARQTLVGVCNLRLFDTQPTPSDLLTKAVAALAGTDCKLMLELASLVDAYNNSGDEEPFPADFQAGPATPQAAYSMAIDPTSPSGQMCGS